MGFTLVEELGKGGMGVVWRARDDQTGQIVALKLLRDVFVEDAEYRVRFEHELDIARRINSAHVVKVLGFGAREGVPYIAFEFVDGPSLRQLLVQHGPYDWSEVRALLLQLAEGLADAHAAGVIHRDVKPSNVMVETDGTAKLADFGISRAIDMTRVTKASGVLGTPAYLAPEGPIDARSDLYSLGVVAFEMLTGSQPFEGSTYQEVLVAHLRKAPDLTKVPTEARPIISWLLAKGPDSRPQTARQLIRVLMGEEPIPVASPIAANPVGVGTAADQTTMVAPRSPSDWSSVTFGGGRTRSAPTTRRMPTAAIAGIVAVVAIVGVVLGAAALQSGRGSPPSQAASTGPVASTAPVVAQTATNSTPTPANVKTQLPGAPTGGWLGLSSLDEEALGDTGCQLPDGRVIVFSTSSSGPHATSLNSWVVDPNTGEISGGPTMKATQAIPGVAALSDGSVMVAGGWQGANPVASAEILDGSSGQWIALPPMETPRSQATVTDLGNGRVLVVGGWIRSNGSDAWTATDTAEIYDRASNTWVWTHAMSTARALATATKLEDGRVLVAGGDQAWSSSSAQQVLSSAEIYNPSDGSWSGAGNMSAPRAAASAGLLPNGHVLVAGGWANGNKYGMASVDQFDPNAGWSRVGDMPGPHAQGRLVTLRDGRVLMMAGLDSAGKATPTVELYNPNTSTWVRTGSLQQGIYWPAAVVLSDGRVLVVGGWNDTAATHLVQIYGPPQR
ncbi:MAG: protein kinase [Candidatus Limnocylindrales bacterium]